MAKKKPPKKGLPALLKKAHPALTVIDTLMQVSPSKEEFSEIVENINPLPKLREDPMGDTQEFLKNLVEVISPQTKSPPPKQSIFNYDEIQGGIEINQSGEKTPNQLHTERTRLIDWGVDKGKSNYEIDNAVAYFNYDNNIDFSSPDERGGNRAKAQQYLEEFGGKKPEEQKLLQNKGLSGIKDIGEERISIFPKPERMFPEDSRPAGGEYLNPKTGDILTDSNLQSGTISITPEGKPSFKTSSKIVEEVGSPLVKGATQIKTNLFRKSAGWKWKDGPKEYLNIPTLVSVENKGKHYYTLEADFPKGINLTRYSKSKTEPRLRPTIKGFIDLGNQIGTILVRGKEHPVYDKISNFKLGGVIRNPYSYAPRDI